MDNKDKLVRIKDLTTRLNIAREIYEQGIDEVMTNTEYDRLYDELLALEEDTNFRYNNSPTPQVGYEVVSKLEKVVHKEKVLSLDKTKDISDLKTFLGDEQGILSFKMDGLTLILEYNNGRLSKAITRGNGEIGEDVTHNAKVIKNIPKIIGYKNNLTIRGEVVMSYDIFEKINSTLPDEEKYKNPRNLASGTLRQLDSKICAERELDFITFEVVKGFDNYYDKTNYREIFYKSEKLDLLEKEGFDIVKYYFVNKSDVSYWKEELTKEVTEYPKYPYPVDGLVLTFDNINYSNSLPTTSKHPKHSIAFKWKDEAVETELIEIEWNTSRTGLINPVAIFKPVEIEGSTVERASLHNISIIEGLNLEIGDRIGVIKANMIIPQIIENYTIKDDFYINIPKNCPTCDSPTEIRDNGNTKTLHCLNDKCAAKSLFKLKHFCSREAMNIEGLSEATLSKLINLKLIKDFTDIYKLTKSDLLRVEGFGEKSANNLLENIEKSKTVQLPNFLYSLGIEGIGRTASKAIAKHFDYDFNKIIESDFMEFSRIDGIGETMARALDNYLDENDDYMRLYDFVINVQKPISTSIQENEKIKGKTFVITGSINKFKSRKELQEYL